MIRGRSWLLGLCACGLAAGAWLSAGVVRADSVEAPTVAATPPAAAASAGSGAPAGEPGDGAAPAAPPAAGEAGPERAAPLDEASAAAAAAPPPRELSGGIERAWFAPAASLDERIWRTRRTSLERGVWSLDGAARALIGSLSVPLDRATAAVQLAPELPAAHMELAKALWLHGESPLAAIRTAAGALAVFWQHPEGALWLGGSLILVLAGGLVGGGILSIWIVGLLSAPHAAHDLGDSFSRSMPAFGRAALLLCLLFLPLMLGEGLLGLTAVMLGLGVAYGGRRQRLALGLAGVAVILGAHPVAQLAGGTLSALQSDPVARAALAASRGLALEAELARLEEAPETDLLAAHTRARLAKRAGNLGAADALYQMLLRETPDDPVVLTNAANVRLHLGHMESAMELYHRALQVEESAVVLYNLSQAYGQAFQVDDLTQTLELAQARDGDLVADLTRLQGAQPEGFVVDLPLRNETIWRRVLDPRAGAPFAAAFRARVAPGRLGSSWVVGSVALAAAGLVGALVGWRLRASRWCARCGRRVCPRCHPEVSGGELCDACKRLFYQPEQTDRELRLARIEALRQREARLDKAAWAASIAIPGAAGLLCRRPMLGLVGALCFAVAAGALVWRQGAVPDPLVAGAAGPFAFACVAVLGGVAYAVVVGTALAARRNL